MLTTDELKAVLASEAAVPRPNADRLTEVHDRVAVHRRLRATAAGLACAAVLVSVGLIAVPRLSSTSSATPASTQPTPSSTGLPEYLRGGRLLAQAETTGPKATSVTFTPTSLDFGWVHSCANPGDPAPEDGEWSTTTVNGHPLGAITCSDALGDDGSGDMARPGPDWDWADFGVEVGRPSTLIATWDGPVDQAAQTRIGIYQAVSWEEFPFPAAPDPLPIVSQNWKTRFDHDPAARLLLTATPDASDGFTYTVPLRKGLQIEAMTAAPGELRLLADDRLVWDSRSWDYTENQASASVSLSELGMKPGETVTLRIEADRFPDATAPLWELRLYDAAA